VLGESNLNINAVLQLKYAIVPSFTIFKILEILKLINIIILYLMVSDWHAQWFSIHKYASVGLKVPQFFTK
jgi:hypothetical protein